MLLTATQFLPRSMPPAGGTRSVPAGPLSAACPAPHPSHSRGRSPRPAGTPERSPAGEPGPVRPRCHRCLPPLLRAGASAAPSAPRSGRPSESPAPVPAPPGVGVSVPPLPDALPVQGGLEPRCAQPRTPPRGATHSRPPLPWLRLHGQRGGGRVTAAFQREPHTPPPRWAGGGSGTDPTAQERPARPLSRQQESPGARVT